MPSWRSRRCLLSGAKPSLLGRVLMSANDAKRTQVIINSRNQMPATETWDMRETCYTGMLRLLKVAIDLGTLLEFKDWLCSVSDWRKRRKGDTFFLWDRFQRPYSVNGKCSQNHVDGCGKRE